MSSRSKGNRNIRKAFQYYQEQDKDWITDRVERTARWIKEKDLFGLFDIIAVAPGGHVHLVQIKSNRPATQKPFKEFAKKYASTRVHVIVMTWYDYKGWRIQRYLKNGKIQEKDLRE
jgi:hypothetical protein